MGLKNALRMEEEIKLRILEGQIVDFPSIPHGGKPHRWCAVITRDYRTPEGIHREPISYNRDRAFPRFDPSPLKLHDALEFGIEWHHPGPRPYRRDQRYFVITEITPEAITLQPCEPALAAIDLGIKLDLARREALRDQLRALQADLEDLEDPQF